MFSPPTKPSPSALFPAHGPLRTPTDPGSDAQEPHVAGGRPVEEQRGLLCRGLGSEGGWRRGRCAGLLWAERCRRGAGEGGVLQGGGSSYGETRSRVGSGRIPGRPGAWGMREGVARDVLGSKLRNLGLSP